MLYLLGAPFDITWDLAPSVLWTVAECTIGICCVSVPPMRPLFGRLLPGVFLTRRIPYDRSDVAAANRRRCEAYAMAGWSGGGGPTDAENKSSEADLTPSLAGDEQIPKSWLGGEDYRGSTPGRSATLRVTELSDVISEPERAMQKG